MLVIIRDERPSDHAAIRAVTLAAFASVPQSRQTEAAIVEALRQSGSLTISLVAVDGEQVIGHIAISPVTIEDRDDRDWYGGGPLAVHPDYQRRGVGTSLIRAAQQRLTDLGACGCVLVGDPAYYQRFGFRSHPGLTMAHVPPANLLAVALGTAEVPSGRVTFAPAFDAGVD